MYEWLILHYIVAPNIIF